MSAADSAAAVLVTAELRFWWSGDAPQAISSWHAALSPFDEERREDSYLWTGNAALGIKRRAGNHRLEVKSLVGFGKNFEIEEARPQIWVKTHCDPVDIPASRRVEVAKWRRRVRLAIRDQRAFHLDEPNSEGASCEIELGRARIANGQSRATLCFEATGEMSSALAHLALAWRTTAPPAAIFTGRQASYPALLLED